MLVKVQNLICHDFEMAIVQAFCIVIVFAILKPNKNVFDVAKFYIPWFACGFFLHVLQLSPLLSSTHVFSL